MYLQINPSLGTSPKCPGLPQQSLTWGECDGENDGVEGWNGLYEHQLKYAFGGKTNLLSLLDYLRSDPDPTIY